MVRRVMCGLWCLLEEVPYVLGFGFLGLGWFLSFYEVVLDTFRSEVFPRVGLFFLDLVDELLRHEEPGFYEVWRFGQCFGC